MFTITRTHKGWEISKINSSEIALFKEIKSLTEAIAIAKANGLILSEVKEKKVA